MSNPPRHPIVTKSRQMVLAYGKKARARRMAVFSCIFGVRPGLRILDLGGRPEAWEGVPGPLEITILNLPGETGEQVETRHNTRFVEGDATAVDFPDQSFDIVFSNSVIEHVGPEDKQRDFANEVRRLAPSYWIQTPSIWFPIEAHTGVPFWFFLPEGVRSKFLQRLRKKLPAWADNLAGTRVIRRGFFEQIFPDARTWVETAGGMSKSYVRYRKG